ncbi:hypothetical protein HD806DRAFT_542893 [Xylariaceae sp. AK1471]|nr:hypothetical protein HD806DRAFT_542893 [Xylariaceae sp. AK1471]
MSPPSSRTKLDVASWFEDLVVYRTHSKLSLFKKQAQPHSTLSIRDRGAIYTGSDEAIDIFGSVAVFVAASAMLIAPLWILQSLDTPQSRLMVITIFAVVCLAFLSVATLGRPFERLAATAGYSAVLVVFLQLGPDGSDR